MRIGALTLAHAAHGGPDVVETAVLWLHTLVALGWATVVGHGGLCQAVRFGEGG